MAVARSLRSFFSLSLNLKEVRFTLNEESFAFRRIRISRSFWWRWIFHAVLSFIGLGSISRSLNFFISEYLRATFSLIYSTLSINMARPAPKILRVFSSSCWFNSINFTIILPWNDLTCFQLENPNFIRNGFSPSLESRVDVALTTMEFTPF